MKNVSVIEARTARIELGKRVRALRKEKKLTQPELSSMCGLCIGHVSKIERAETNITVNTAVAIAMALGVRLSDLFTDIAFTDLSEREACEKAHGSENTQAQKQIALK